MGGGEETKPSSWFWRQLCEFVCRSQAFSHLENVWTKASCNISSIIVAVELVRLSTRGGLIVCLLVSLRVVLCNLSVCHIHLLFSSETLLIQIHCSSTLSNFALHPLYLCWFWNGAHVHMLLLSVSCKSAKHFRCQDSFLMPCCIWRTNVSDDFLRLNTAQFVYVP